MNNSTKRLIGLTGGIATGKTTVSKYLANKYHLPILDADIYAREAVSGNSPILQNIFQRYGEKVILVDRSLNRSALGEIIFNSPQEKKWLENQIHPYVRDRFNQELQSVDSNLVVLDIPLLFEANLTDTVTEIWVVICDRSIQVQRLCQRNSLNVMQANRRIDSQLPLTDKITRADVVLNNNIDLDSLFKQVDKALMSTA